jgi:flagellar assembly factor FliW
MTTTLEAPRVTQKTAEPIRFVSPIPGFPDDVEFDLAFDDDPHIKLGELVSRNNPEAHFFVCPPAGLFGRYTPPLPDSAVIALGVPDPSDLVVLVLLNVSDRSVGPTANLMAPIVINVATRQAIQVVLDDRYPVRAPLLARS